MPRESQQRTDYRSISHPSNANDHISLRSLTAKPMLDVVAKSSLFRVPAAFAARGRRPRVAAPPMHGHTQGARRRSGPRRPDVTGQRFAAISRTSAGRRPRRERLSISRGSFATAQRNMISAHRAQTSSPSGGVRTTNSSGANLLRGDRSEHPRFLPAPCGAIWQTQTLVEPSAPNEFGLILERRATKGTALVDA